MLDVYTANSLDGVELERPSMIVEDLLPAGLTVFAGSPKLGKSWLVLSLCCSVATQQPFLGRQTIEGGVLYLDLEGSRFRLQDRLSQLGLGFPEYLTVSHTAPQLGDGLLEDIQRWQDYSKAFPRLVVIDTIARIKPPAKRGLNAYEADSKIFAPLQEYALKNGVAIVLVTHLKKADRLNGSGADWVERVSGSMGLAGVSDNVWGLFRQRGSETAYLRTSSRDVDAGDMVLKFKNGLWKFVSDDMDGYEFKQRPLVRFIVSKQILQGTAAELCDKYMDFCKSQGLPHGLSDNQPVAGFGKQLKRLKPELWRVRKSLTQTKKSDATWYRIADF